MNNLSEDPLKEIKKELGTIVRDITKIGFAPKSVVRDQMEELIDQAYTAGKTELKEKLLKEMPEVRDVQLAKVNIKVKRFNNSVTRTIPTERF